MPSSYKIQHLQLLIDDIFVCVCWKTWFLREICLFDKKNSHFLLLFKRRKNLSVIIVFLKRSIKLRCLTLNSLRVRKEPELVKKYLIGEMKKRYLTKMYMKKMCRFSYGPQYCHARIHYSNSWLSKSIKRSINLQKWLWPRFLWVSPSL